MRKLASVVLVASCSLAVCGAARADDSMRCGSQIIMVGAKLSDVLQYCGEPNSKTVEDAAKREGKYYEGTTPIEHWTYTSGAVNSVLTFDQGVLISIDAE